MSKFESVLKFNEYVVNEVYFKSNPSFHKEKDNSIDIELNIIPNIVVEGEKLTINLVTKIFENTDENERPFNMKIDITGFFETKGDKPESFQANAIAIMYPYVRSIVSTYTASANIQPLILPAINVNAMLENSKK